MVGVDIHDGDDDLSFGRGRKPWADEAGGTAARNLFAVRGCDCIHLFRPADDLLHPIMAQMLAGRHEDLVGASSAGTALFAENLSEAVSHVLTIGANAGLTRAFKRWEIGRASGRNRG